MTTVSRSEAPDKIQYTPRRESPNRKFQLQDEALYLTSAELPGGLLTY